MVLPSSLNTVVRKIQVNANIYKLIPNVSTVSSGSILSITMAENGLVDWKAFALAGQIVSSANVGIGKFMPIFNRVLIEIGGRVLASTNYLPEIQTVLNQLASSDEQRKRKVPFMFGSTATSAVTDSTNTNFIIDEFPGTFIGTTSSPLMDLSLLPQMKLHFYCESGSVSLCGSGAGRSFTLNNVYGSIKSYSIQDGGEYYQKMQAFLKTVGNTKNITWVNPIATLNSQGVNSTTCLDVSTNSLAKAFACPFVSQGTFGASNATSKASECFTRAVNADNTWQFYLNQINVPQYLATSYDAYTITADTFNHKYNHQGSFENVDTQAKWLNPYWCAAVSFELPNNDVVGERWVSGYNSLDQCAKLSFTYSGSAASSPATSTMLVALTNPILKIKANREFDVIP